ncbi:MAG: class I SAM-dependent methyltransferase [Acidobacteriota bacterium]
MASFLRQFVQAPARTGAVAPSSRHLADRMMDCARVSEASVIIEMGPGTGVFTERIAAEIRPGSRFFALEVNETFAATTRQRCPGVTVHHDSAANARAHLERSGESSCDLVISSLPWASFGPRLQAEILDTIGDMLRPGGRLLTFAYLQGLALPSGQKFRRQLEARFSRVEKSRTVWRNVPPAFIYTAVK